MLLRLEINEIAHTEMLVRLGYLHPTVADDPEAINHATETMLSAICLVEEKRRRE
jgi:hypothetical protein